MSENRRELWGDFVGALEFDGESDTFVEPQDGQVLEDKSGYENHGIIRHVDIEDVALSPEDVWALHDESKGE